MSLLRVGSRGSALALRQTEIVVAALAKADPSLKCEVRVIKTTGDKMLDAPFTQMVGRGFFTKEIEEALLAREIDFAVHSLKDLPTEMPEGLVLAAVTKREDPRDALVSTGKKKLSELPKGARVGTSSPRRQMQLLAARPDLKVVPLRGNLSTRMKKVLAPNEEAGGEKLDAAVLALAGIRRLRLDGDVSEVLPVDVMLPAVGQGFLGVQVRLGDAATLKLLAAVNDEAAACCAAAERAFLKEWGGGCSVPLGALAETDGVMLRLRGVVYSDELKKCLKNEARGAVTQAEKLGKQLAEKLKT